MVSLTDGGRKEGRGERERNGERERPRKKSSEMPTSAHLSGVVGGVVGRGGPGRYFLAQEFLLRAPPSSQEERISGIWGGGRCQGV